MVRTMLRWFSYVALWLALTAHFNRQEVVAGVLVATLVMIFGRRVSRAVGLEVSFQPRWLRRLVQLPGQVSRDLVTLARHLAHPKEPGLYRAVPCRVGGTSAADRGRRALVTAAASLGPDTYVLGWDLDRQVVLVHQLERSAQVLPTADGVHP